jgi:flagellar biosynthesis protein FlgN
VTPRQRLAEIVRQIQADGLGYDRLGQLLEQQFQAALRHDAVALEQLAHEISTLVGELERRRAARVEHTTALLPRGQAPSMQGLIQRLDGPLRLQVMALWSKLEEQVRECKASNLRNCRLIMEQAALMKRVLAGVEGTYAPG